MKRLLTLHIICLSLCTFICRGQKNARDSVVVRHIIFEGNKRTKTSVLLREMSVNEGSRISTANIEELAEQNRKRLINLPLFTEVIITTETANDSTVDWRINVKEQWYIIPELTLRLADRNFNVWWNEKNHDIRRANLGVTLKHRNFRGALEQLGVTVQIGYTQKFGIEYFKPYIDKKQQHGIGASFFFSKNEETFYITDSNKLRFIKTQGSYIMREFEAATLYVFRPGYATKHSIELRYRDWKVDDTITKLNSDYYANGSKNMKLLEFTYRYDLNNVDNWNYPTTGLKVVGHAIVRAGIEGMDFQAQVMAEAGYFKRFGRKWLLAEVFRGRLSIPEKQPYIFRNALGSNSDYVRGYEYYVIDGSQYGLLRTNLKYELVNTAIRNFPIRYLATIPIRIYPKVFFDAGIVRNKYAGNSILNNRPLLGYGFGVDIVTTYDFKVRLEYTFNHLAEKELFLHLDSE